MIMWDEMDKCVKEWIEEAGERIKKSFLKQLTIETKSNRNDLVTDMDKETEQFFIKNINEKFPDHRILGEEGFGDSVEDTKGVLWIIDPIDGTMNFVHQQRNFAISIGIYENGVGRLGYIYDVVHNELYHAKKGEGAFMNDQKLPNLPSVALEDAVIALNALWLTTNKHMDSSKLVPLVRDVRAARSYGSAALEMAYVAAGRLDAYLTMRLAPWDFAAGKILIEEVGGVVTNLKGESLDVVRKDSVFVGKPTLHQDILQRYLT
ncbi:inositol monophosphatase family protein [Bacillus spongiae]|uniref:inositol-phosphate phosphatase n=1 Tax=Bacillus spongiae TaxID=2683610 RepID=A0ABU8H9Q3_9BACI